MLRSAKGQASVELVAVLPALVLVAAVAWQVAVAGQAAWLAGSAARAGARAEAVDADPERAARSVLPPRLERGMRVQAHQDGSVSVDLEVPLVAGAGHLATVGASARLQDQGG